MNTIHLAILSLAVWAAAAAPRAQQPLPIDVEPPAPVEELRLNFKGVDLDTVLDYLSRAAGFIVVKEVDVAGTVDVISQQPLSPDEALEVLNTVLHGKGYAAIRSGRILTIVDRDDARARDIPVRQGNNPDAIERSDQMVTQIIPVRYAKATELVEDVQPLLPEWATLTANESSNALVLTDTQTGVRRIAEIIRALDQSISEISAVRVFNLRYADAKEVATMIQTLYQQQQAGANEGSRRREVFQRFRGPWGGGGGGGGDADQEQAASAALQAGLKVVAVADERTNSIIVSAPEDLIDTIESLVAAIDRSTDILTEVRVFPLRYSNAEQMVEVIEGIFAEESENQNQPQQRRFRGPGGFWGNWGRGGGGGGGGGGNNTQEQSERRVAENTVLAVADTRTNSVVVSAVSAVMDQVEQVIAELDRDPARNKQVFVYSVQNASPEDVAILLQEMFGGGGGSSLRRSTNQNTGGANPNPTPSLGGGGGLGGNMNRNR
ncbi:MAG TPA: secretin N-terminal domain-containing protein [Candidatus Sumerlaeota bacterium]|nr:MAG: Type II secretion system protein D precursor [candidate division BRC1 bacterium ADurb.BinA292]HOE95010.1 secretin N-terminal domain-containing protein [Candidatus Sumerlaeota bacterium]HOR26450.1 secretin N-terminal domain-containing protein [Candidatus Sumerlaeota bacterium]HPK00834.1 secretin N-terminal domain-containing protein [Candidatus Sumerlaeota bacterium]